MEPIKCRLVRVELDNENFEVLITSLLGTENILHKTFKELYHLRWPVEENYKLLKCRLEVENFSGMSVESIYQDFFAKIFMANLASILASETDENIEKKTSHRKLKYKTNWSNVISKMRTSVFLLFLRKEFETILQ